MSQTENRTYSHADLEILKVAGGEMLKGVILDLDGLLVCTEELHLLSWNIALQSVGIRVDSEFLDNRLRGLARREAILEILGEHQRELPIAVQESILDAKSRAFTEILPKSGLRPVPGALPLIKELRATGAKTAVGSSSRNARAILEYTGLLSQLDAVVDGNDAPSKPHPEVFQKAATAIQAIASECIVLEDALAGIIAATRGGFKSVAVGPAARFNGHAPRVDSLERITVPKLLDWHGGHCDAVQLFRE